MKILFIGGTGTLSKDTVMLAAKNSDEVFLFNRGNSNSRITLKNVNYIKGDIYDFENSKKSLDSYNFDVVVDYLVFNIESLKQRIKLFQNKTKQYIYIYLVLQFFLHRIKLLLKRIKGEMMNGYIQKESWNVNYI